MRLSLSTNFNIYHFIRYHYFEFLCAVDSQNNNITVTLSLCVYAHHSIQLSDDSHGHSSVSIHVTVTLSHCVYAQHSIQPSNDSHGHSSVSTTVLSSLCVYAHHSILPSNNSGDIYL